MWLDVITVALSASVSNTLIVEVEINMPPSVPVKETFCDHAAPYKFHLRHGAWTEIIFPNYNFILM